MMNLKELKEYHSKLEGKRSHLQEELEEAEKSLTYWKKRYDKSLKARIVIQTAAKETQSTLEQRFSNIVTLALRSIPFPSNYEFLLEIVERRNKTEVDKKIESLEKEIQKKKKSIEQKWTETKEKYGLE